MTQDAKVNVYWTFGGDLFAGDAEDENAPLMQLRWCNEAKALTRMDKLRAAKAMVDAAIDEPLALRQRPALSAEAQRGLRFVRALVATVERYRRDESEASSDAIDTSVENIINFGPDVRAFLDAVAPEGK